MGGSPTRRTDFHLGHRAGLKSPVGLRRPELDPPREDGQHGLPGTRTAPWAALRDTMQQGRGACPTKPYRWAAFSSGLVKRTWLQV